jgi:hypothetical protein
MILKVFCKILVSFGLVQNLETLDLPMAKVKKVNIAVSSFNLGYKLNRLSLKACSDNVEKFL